MTYEQLRRDVCEANRFLGESGLVMLTWGNVSGVDRDNDVMAIKPSGVAYADLEPADIVVLSLSSGEVVGGDGRPSSDTPTHLHLYREFSGAGGVVHTHSHYATVMSQARREVPCLGTTHADNFHGAVPLTRMMSEKEVRGEYELETGRVIVERFRQDQLDPMRIPGVLVAGHGPFAWGGSVGAALENALVLEEVACMAFHATQFVDCPESIPSYLLDKHYLRKHGDSAYYGQA
jgi:L-ribulose-5-phosphate 4-epimerase